MIDITQQARAMATYIQYHLERGGFIGKDLDAYIEQQLRQREDVGWHEAEQALLDYNGDTLFDTFRNELLIQIRSRRYSTLNLEEGKQ